VAGIKRLLSYLPSSAPWFWFVSTYRFAAADGLEILAGLVSPAASGDRSRSYFRWLWLCCADLGQEPGPCTSSMAQSVKPAAGLLHSVTVETSGIVPQPVFAGAPDRFSCSFVHNLLVAEWLG